MTELHTPSPQTPLNPELPELESHSTVEVPRSLSWQLPHTVLTLLDPTALTQVPPPPIASPEAIAAMQRLVQIVAQLRSPTGGWPDDLPQTADNLALYVSEEAHEVLEALQQQPAVPANPFTVTQTNPFEQRYFLGQDLIPRFLWYIARGADTLMQLVGGVRANIIPPDTTAQSGILRLVVTLTLQAGEQTQTLDLVTGQTPPDPVPESTLIASQPDSFCPHPLPCGELLQKLRQQIMTATPEASLFLNPVPVELLAPDQDWQIGTLQLHLSFSFLPQDTSLETLLPEAAPVLSPEEERLLPDMLFPDTPELTTSELGSVGTQIQFTDPGVLECYTQTTIQQHLEHLLYQTSLTKLAAANPPSFLTVSSDDGMLSIVSTASSLVDTLYPAIALPDAYTTEPEVWMAAALMERWIPTLLWHLARTSYDVMQWVGGVRAKVLQPAQAWQTGTLRLLATLQITTPNLDWQFDLSTGQQLSGERQRLSAQTVVQLMQGDRTQDLHRISNIREQLEQHLHESAPLLGQLLSGTPIELLTGLSSWQSGTLQLHLALELLPDAATL